MRSAVPLGHKLIAVLVAVASACGLYAFLRAREARLASAASLSFDSTEARQLDPAIAHSAQPAVVLAQSILSDSAVSRLLAQLNLSASSTPLAIGEFRTRLELSQPTAGLLYVRYRDADSGQAAANANAVAEALTAWSPSNASAPPPAANAAPAPAPKPAPAPQPAPAPAQNHPAAGPSLAAALGDLQNQLSAADQHFGPGSSLSEHDRQRWLEAQVHDAQQKLGDLRSQFTQAGAQARFDPIQHALAHFWPAAAGMSTAGTSEAQLRYEREQLTNVIGVIAQQRQAAQHQESAGSAPADPPAPQAAPAPQETDLPAHQQQPAPTAQPSPTASAPPPASGDLYNPLHLDRMAGLPAAVTWWPSALVGCFCGVLYWGLIFARYRSAPDYDDSFDLSDAGSSSAYRLITPDTPVAAPASIPLDPPREVASHKRASFSFEPNAHIPADEPPAIAPPEAHASEIPPLPVPAPTLEVHPAAEPAPASPPPEPPAVETRPLEAAPLEAAPLETAPLESPALETPARETPAFEPPALIVEPAPSPAAALPEHPAESRHAAPAEPAPRRSSEPDEIFREKVVEIADPWADEVRKNLSQTTIGRMLDALIMAEEQQAAAAAAKNPASEDAPPPAHSDRLAG